MIDKECVPIGRLIVSAPGAAFAAMMALRSEQPLFPVPPIPQVPVAESVKVSTRNTASRRRDSRLSSDNLRRLRGRVCFACAGGVWQESERSVGKDAMRLIEVRKVIAGWVTLSLA